MLEHVQKLLRIPGASVLFGGKELFKHSIPKQYGAIEPTAVFVPLEGILASEDNFKLVTTEVFGPLQVAINPCCCCCCCSSKRPFTHVLPLLSPALPDGRPVRFVQVITKYSSDDLDRVLGLFERMGHHLTAAVVSNDVAFQHSVLAHTVNGTTYAGIRARTTGAPQNHWFGPAGDPRGAGIGTQEAIQLVWSCHREVISDCVV